ncbi:hypothetical protein C922_03731 [Plasmodium inui San Antonio 1]|uniref:Uncharacterized protein n=1 Tax=Plasmodium inui San Antonio 1 TaxID=1237626 RepID=W7A325_9APIC|nr:hypothetical protein C922_03731 [Plasmodium inui San Antonio 1]EUD65748.1 hypothetical protein C922_03731 [Plasmodium inui San Antonio 1]
MNWKIHSEKLLHTRGFPNMKSEGRENGGESSAAPERGVNRTGDRVKGRRKLKTRQANELKKESAGISSYRTGPISRTIKTDMRLP